MSAILFYGPKERPYGCFSNFSRHTVEIYGLTWQTSEAPFQAMKFYPDRVDLFHAVHKAESPTRAAEIGRTPGNPLREDWNKPAPEWEMVKRFAVNPMVDDGRGIGLAIELTKDLVMYEVVYAKFNQNKDIQAILLETGDSPLVENSIHDPYWGIGSSGTGVNRLGRVLMAVREALIACTQH